MSTDCGCKAWIFHEDGTSKHTLHQGETPEMLTHDDLRAIGVEYYRMDKLDEDPELEKLRHERGYTNFDVVNITAEFPLEKLEQFYDEHLHDDEEIRLCMDGSGFFDLRTKDDARWVRVHCQKGDLIIIPAGIYHRFTLDEHMYIKAMRLFTSAPKWIPYSRANPDTEDMDIRKQYITTLTNM